MEALKKEDRPTHPFNSALETGIRALVVLEAFYPRRCDLTELTWFDHLVVHTSDIDDDSPESLHPALPNREGELLVRRHLLEHSVRLMHQVHLIDIEDTEEGVVYSASEDAPSFLSLLQAPYTVKLKERADWVANRFADLAPIEIRSVISDRIGRWTAEFRAEHANGDAS